MEWSRAVSGRRTARIAAPRHPTGASHLKSCILLGALGVLTVACGPDAPTAANKQAATLPSVPQFLENTAFNSAGQCMGDDAVALAGGTLVSGMNAGTDPEAFVCNAKEVFIATATITQVFDPEANAGAGGFVPYDANNPPQCVETESITFKMTAVLQQHATSERADIGVWIATDGGNAKTGDCNQYNLPKNSLGTINTDGDQCAGLGNEGQTTIDLGELTVPCNPDPVTNKLSVGSCIGWKVPSDGDDASCADNKDGVGASGTPDDFRAATLPVNKTKCNCEPFLLDVVVVKKATIEVKKVCDPTTDNGTFDLEIDGVVKKTDATCAGGAASTTGTVEVGAGTSASDPPGADHNVAESGFTAANYTSTVSCTKNGAAYIASQAYTADADLSVHTNPNDAIVCTFVNTRKGTIEIEKITSPSPDVADTDFGFASPSLNPTSFTLKNGGIRTFTNVAPNTTTGYAVTENDPTPGYDLTSISCTNPDNQNASTTDLATRLATVKVNAGETVRCTFTNRKRASVTIKKVTDPAESPAVGSFTFSNPFDGTGSFNLGHDGTKTFTGVVPGAAKSVVESDPVPAGYDLTNIACTGASTYTGTVATRTLSVTPAAGEVIVCTFTNTRRATVQVNKRENGTLPLSRAWAFQIRTGTTDLAAGTVRATGAADVNTGVVNFSCSPNPNAVCTNVGGVANFVPSPVTGGYQFCEVNMPAGYSNNIAGFTPAGSQPEGADNGDECINITLAAGASGMPSGITVGNVNIDNTPPPGGDARTIGYWKNHSCLAPGNQEDVLSPLLPISVGIGFADASDFVIAAGQCELAVSILDKRSYNNGKKMASDGAYNLASQLVAALLNIKAQAGSCDLANSAIADGQKLLDEINFDGSGAYLKSGNAKYALAVSLAGTLDKYNNNQLCPPAP